MSLRPRVRSGELESHTLPVPVLVVGEPCPLCGEVHVPEWPTRHLPVLLVDPYDSLVFGWSRLTTAGRVGPEGLAPPDVLDHPRSGLPGGPECEGPRKSTAPAEIGGRASREPETEAHGNDDQ